MPRSADLNLGLGRVVHSLRKFESLSLRELAARSGVSEKTIGKIESGKPVADLNVLALIGEGLGRDLTSLLQLAQSHRTEAILSESRRVLENTAEEDYVPWKEADLVP